VKPAPFKYVRPTTVQEALSVLSKHRDEARTLAGGQSLGAMLNMRIVTPGIVMDINRIPELCTITTTADSMITGAMVTQRDALDHQILGVNVPLLKCALPSVGHYQTRNRGTLGGSVVHADPSAEIPLVLATLGGQVELRSTRRTRRIPTSQFFMSALTTAREPDELLTALHWPRSPATQQVAFREFAVREGDFALVAVACVLDVKADRVRLGFGGCGEVPAIVEMKDVASIDGPRIQAIAQEAASRLEYRSDLLASAEYRKHLAVTLVRRTLTDATAVESSHA
jgi:2-furoyl-CoA dehydrogenase FAD binding subunit